MKKPRLYNCVWTGLDGRFFYVHVLKIQWFRNKKCSLAVLTHQPQQKLQFSPTKHGIFHPWEIHGRFLQPAQNVPWDELSRLIIDSEDMAPTLGASGANVDHVEFMWHQMMGKTMSTSRGFSLLLGYPVSRWTTEGYTCGMSMCHFQNFYLFFNHYFGSNMFQHIRYTYVYIFFIDILDIT